jgi:hypothetical protein
MKLPFSKPTMPHTFVQEVVVSVSNAACFTRGSSNFEAEMFLRDSGNSLSNVAIQLVHASPVPAFQEAIKSVAHYLGIHSLTVASINSPCNAQFVNKSQQTTVLQSSGIHIVSTVNGQQRG